jgi:hypothetical protein
MKRGIDITGQRFGQSVVIGQAPKRGSSLMWECACDCGERFVTRGSSLRGGTRSCGCANRAAIRAATLTHGASKTPTYRSWKCMRNRCDSSLAPNYALYGGRGIRICDRWQSFENFLADMGERPAGTSLDRINPDGDYEPNNCRWATAKQQSRNRRNSRLDDCIAMQIRWLVGEGGQRQCDVMRALGLSAVAVSEVVNNRTWVPEEHR